MTVLSISFSTLEVLRAERILRKQNIVIDVFEIVRLDQLDLESILESLNRTRKLLIVDIGHAFAGWRRSAL